MTEPNTANRVCYSCQHFDLVTGEHDYSDVTPGSDFKLLCYKHVWKFDAYEDGVDKFRECLARAETCELFTLSDDLT